MLKPSMSRLLSLSLGCAIFVGPGAGCSSETSELSCDEASVLLSACTESSQAGCSDDDPAAQRIGSCPDSDKADIFGNGVPGESCFWNWECKGDESYTCNHGNCFRRNTAGNLCDRGDDSDCLPELYCADDLSTPGNIEGICSTSEEDVIPALYA